MKTIEITSHSYKVGVLAKALFLEAGMDESKANELGACAVFHDVGKAFISSEVLNKPGRLTEDEFAQVKMHPSLGADFLLKAVPTHPMAEIMARDHHERANGTGYPAGLKEADTPFEARVCGLADVFEALCAKRCYKGSMKPEEALAMIYRGECGTFSEDVLSLIASDDMRETISAIVKNDVKDDAIDELVSSIQEEMSVSMANT